MVVSQSNEGLNESNVRNVRLSSVDDGGELREKKGRRKRQRVGERGQGQNLNGDVVGFFLYLWVFGLCFLSGPPQSARCEAD
jgi:hypothetical protein